MNESEHEFRSPEEAEAAAQFNAETNPEAPEMGEQTEPTPVKQGRSFLEKGKNMVAESLKTYFTLPDNNSSDRFMSALMRVVGPATIAMAIKLAAFPAEGSVVQTDPVPAYAFLASVGLMGATVTAGALYQSYETRQRRKAIEEGKNQDG